MRPVLLLITVGLAIYALIDVLRSENDEVQYLPRLLWAAVIVVAPIMGPAVYLLLGRTTPGGGGGGGGPRKVVGPDDDPDFLRQLDADQHGRQHPSPDEPGEDEAPKTP